MDDIMDFEDQGPRKRPWGLVIAISIVGLVALIAAGLAVKMLMFNDHFQTRTDTIVFTRDIARDNGRFVDLAALVADNKQTRYADICPSSDDDKAHSPYSADLEQPNGRGLNAVFVRVSGNRQISKETLTILPWRTDEETSQRDRRNLFEQKCSELAAMAERFAARANRTCVQALVVDTTNGMDSILSSRVHETLAASGALLTGSTCADGGLYAYRLTENPSQGDRRTVTRADYKTGSKDVESWLIQSQREQGESSVLRGLAAALTEISRLPPADVARVNVFTDGLENVGERSAYKHDELLDPAGWPELDKAWNPAGLKLTGLDVHLYPLPGQNDVNTGKMMRALTYLKTRIENAGGTATIEPL